MAQRMWARQQLTSVLQLLMVDADLDRHRCIDQADQRCGHANEVGGSAVGGSGVASHIGTQTATDDCVGRIR